MTGCLSPRLEKAICLQPLISHYLVTPSNLVNPQDDPGQQLVVVPRGDFSLTVLALTSLTYTNGKFGSGTVTSMRYLCDGIHVVCEDVGHGGGCCSSEKIAQ